MDLDNLLQDAGYVEHIHAAGDQQTHRSWRRLARDMHGAFKVPAPEINELGVKLERSKVDRAQPAALS